MTTASWDFARSASQTFRGLTALIASLFAWPSLAAPGVTESERSIPVAYEVDVLVVGGASGAAAAAIAAAGDGARVFLMSPRPYLGDDLCETRRLWLEDGEVPATPLAQRIFTNQVVTPSGPTIGTGVRDPHALAFTYEASLPADARHKDTQPPSLLADGWWGRPENQSVQFNGDVTLTADLGARREVQEAALVLYRRSGDFDFETVTLETSADHQSWKTVATVKGDDLDGPVVTAKLAVRASIRYARFVVKRPDNVARLLLGEIMLTAPSSQPEVAAGPKAEPPKPFAQLVKPMQVKRTLDEALLEAKVDFLFSCFPTELLRDPQGQPCGLVMANRAGRQAVLAKVIVDATPRAVVARLAGAQFAPYPAGEQIFTRVLVGGAPRSGPAFSSRKLDFAYRTAGGKYALLSSQADVVEYTLRLPMRDGSFAAFAEADQRSRDLLWSPDQLDLAETLFQVPPDPVQGVKASRAGWQGVAALPLEAFRPARLARFYVLGGCADVSRPVAGALLRPLAYMDMGARIGVAAAAEAKAIPAVRPDEVTIAPAEGVEPEAVASGEVKELLAGVRPTQRNLPVVRSPKRHLPVLGRYEVVIVGGGTGGAPAGVGASRAGAKTLLLEYLNGLGGVGTLGRIITYYYGYRGGFTAQVDAGIKRLGATNYVVGKSEWWRQANRQAGTEIWFGVVGCGAFVEDGIVKGVVVATPFGRGLVLAKTVIDSTGNSDIAVAAGALSDYTGADDVGVQGAGLPPLDLGDHYTNTDWTFADDTDVVDFWQHHILARQKFRTAYDLGQLVDTRERRRIVGDVTITPMDIILGRTWPDALNQAMSNFDTHGFTVHPLFFAMPPDRQTITAYVPLRALLPKGLDGILVTGLGASAHRDAMPIIRMQPDVQNQGYACGYAAAQVANSAASIRQVDIKAVQKHLVETAILPEHALTDQDSLPQVQENLAQAVKTLTVSPAGPTAEADGVIKNRQALATIMAQPGDAIPLLEEGLATSKGDSRLASALILGLLGRPAAADTLLPVLRDAKRFDKGWNYTGMGQFGRCASELDACLIALGRTRDPRALDAVLEKVSLLDAQAEFSHHRACAMALETLRDPRAATALAELLQKPGMMGHAFTNMEKARAGTGLSGTETKPRNESLRELILARALYRCGDKDGLGGKILSEYAQDLRGHYARHARAVLEEKQAPKF